MNVIWRTLLTIWRAKLLLRQQGTIEPTAVSRVRVRTLPTDIDLLKHMNNGRYGSLFDLGRFDLLIRTGGERRLSDFLLWEAAYAELHFTSLMWPEFGAAELRAAVAEFATRERRFGGVPDEAAG